jgi:hypothetical protein
MARGGVHRDALLVCDEADLIAWIDHEPLGIMKAPVETGEPIT